MFFFRRAIFFLLIILTGSLVLAAEISEALPAEIAAENQTILVEMYRLRLSNQKNGPIEASTDQGTTWQQLGQVLKPSVKINPDGFTASKWGKSGSVVASAVNAIHIKTGQNRKNNKGLIFSILPAEYLRKDSKNYSSYLDGNSSIITDLRGGTKLFGGDWSVFVGDLVYLEKAKKLVPLPYAYVPALEDRLLIVVRRPEPYPHEVIFENKAGGIIYLKYLTGQTKPIGQVLKPVLGIGRFIGTEDTDVGRVRANHTGVIDISTSPLGKIGGFQIIPARHSESPEMISAKVKTQWMVVGPLYGLSAGEEGLSPLFSGYIVPRYVDSDFYSEEWKEKVTQRTLVSVQYKGKKTWEPMPVYYVDPEQPLPEKYNTVLADIEKIRILFPMFARNAVKKTEEKNVSENIKL